MTTLSPEAANTSSLTPSNAAQVLDGQPNTSEAHPNSSHPAEVADDPSKTTPKTAGDEKISPKLALLIQREKAALARERSAKAKELEIADLLKKYQDREAREKEQEELKRTQPLKWLEQNGLNYQDLTQVALNDGSVTPEMKIKELESKFNSYTHTQEEALRVKEENDRREEERRNQDTINGFKGDIGNYLKENQARYELMHFENSEDGGAALVYDVIDEHYTRTLKEKVDKAKEEDPEADTSTIRGEILTIAQAADKIELHLEQKYDKARALSKIKALLSAQEKKPVAQKLPNTQTPSQKPQTLNNNLSATPAAQRKGILTDAERIAKAVAYGRGLRPQV